jgi:AraC-like DNA-binding protein
MTGTMAERGLMTMKGTTADLEQRDLQAAASVRSKRASDGIVDQRVTVDHELISVRSVHVGIDGMTVVHGASTARRQVLLHVRDHVPALALHITLHGAALPHAAGRPPARGTRAGEWMLLAGHDALDVTMDAGVANSGLRINFTHRYLESLAQRCPELTASELGAVLKRNAPRTVRIEPMPLGTLADLVEDLRHSEQYGDLRRLFVESTALTLLVRALSCQDVERPPLGGQRRERMLDARAHLLANMRTPPTLAAVARVLGTNEFRLKRDFKLLFGEPVHAFLLRRRLEHARVLLRDRDRSVKEIAAEVGYAHVGHFSAAFRKRFGVPPTAMRVDGASPARDG